MNPTLRWVSVPNPFVSLFVYFVLPPFEENGLSFWVPGVLCQHSEVVLWKLLSNQMIFWWICGGESDLPILFLQHLRTTPRVSYCFNYSCLIPYPSQLLSLISYALSLILYPYPLSFLLLPTPYPSQYCDCLKVTANVPTVNS